MKGFFESGVVMTPFQLRPERFDSHLGRLYKFASSVSIGVVSDGRVGYLQLTNMQNQADGSLQPLHPLEHLLHIILQKRPLQAHLRRNFLMKFC